MNDEELNDDRYSTATIGGIFTDALKPHADGEIEQPEVWKICREGARHPGVPLDAAFVSAAHLSSISIRTALTRRNRASSPGKTQTLTVRRLSSCWTERSIRFEVRSRFR